MSESKALLEEMIHADAVASSTPANPIGTGLRTIQPARTEAMRCMEMIDRLPLRSRRQLPYTLKRNSITSPSCTT